MQPPDDPTSKHPPIGPRASDDDDSDLSLIRWMLSMTPEERVETLQAHIRAIHELRDGIHS